MNRISQPITITLPPKLLRMADKISKDEGRSRSELFRDALRAFLWKRRWEAIQTYGIKQARRTGLKEKDIEGIVEEVRHSRHAARGFGRA